MTNNKNDSDAGENLPPGLDEITKKAKNKILEIYSFPKKVIKKNNTNPTRKMSTLLISGVAVTFFVGYSVSEVLSENRYPILEEYSIIESCVSGANRPLARGLYSKKREICACALSNTQDDFDYSNYKNNETEFLNKFSENAIVCN